MTAEWTDVFLDAIGMTGAAIAFGVGLAQYRRAQQWKRAEFLANEMKALSADLRAATALTMIDWATRRIRLLALDDPANQSRTIVTYRSQCEALYPHVLVDSRREERSAGSRESIEEGISVARRSVGEECASDGSYLREYTREETLIRDCYDSLLDRFDRLGQYLERRLMSAADMAPYVSYYVDDIAAPAGNPTEAFWNVSLLTYIHFYHFTSVPILFESFGHNIWPDGSLFAYSVKMTSDADRPIADKLQQLAFAESSRRRGKHTATRHVIHAAGPP